MKRRHSLNYQGGGARKTSSLKGLAKKYLW